MNGLKKLMLSFLEYIASLLSYDAVENFESPLCDGSYFYDFSHIVCSAAFGFTAF